MKTCRYCNEAKPLTDYCVNRATADGLNLVCKPCASAKHKAWREANRGKASALQMAYAKRHPARVAARNKQWNEENADHLRRYRAERRKDPAYRLHVRLVSGVRQAARTTKDITRFVKGMDYTVGELRAHLEKQFLRGMSWEKMSLWHIDHIVPVSSFDLSTDEGIHKAWALPNLRPLWAKDNRKKAAKRTHLL